MRKKKNSIMREQSQDGLSFAERKNFRPTAKFLLILALLCAVVQVAWADDGWSVWNGGEIYYNNISSNPPTVVDDWVQINSAHDLAYVTLYWNNCMDGRTDLGVYYKRNYQLNVNLDLTSVTWKPLGRVGQGEHEDKGLEGFFNGNGHTIKLKIENTSENNQGLFYEIHPTGKVWNLHVDCDIRVGNARLVGGIAGENNGTIENCWVSGHIESSHYSVYDADLGGIAGINEDEGDILYCCVTANVTNTGGNSGVGGIAGSNEGEIYHVTFTGDVSVNHDQYNKYVGDQDGTLEYYYDTFNQGEYDTAGPENQNQKLYARAIKYPTITTYTINNANDWDEFVMYIRNGHLFSGKTVQLAKDISVTTTVGGGESNSFQGTFDGDGHTLTVNYNTTEAVTGPFRFTKNATISNLCVAGTISTNAMQAAGIVAQANGSLNLTNCRSSVTINSSRDNTPACHGGLVGWVAEGGTATISGCVFDGALVSVEGKGKDTECGGFVAMSEGTTTIRNSLLNPSSVSNGMVPRTFIGASLSYPIENSYFVAVENLPTNQGTKAIALTSAPITLGNLVQDYGMVKIYDYALLFDGKYYVAMGLPGAGTEASPYLINDDGRWNLFTDYVTKGYNFNGEFVRLNADMSVVTMAGADDANSFQGTFDGYGHTLTFTKGTSGSPFDENYCAPFRHVKNATIKNLHVAGTIYTSAQKAAGFVGESHGALTIMGSRSSININSSRSGDGTHGGFVATLSGSNNTILIDGCVFDGSFATTANTTNCGGFVGWPVYNRPVISNSLMKPGSVDAGMLINTFARWHSTYEPTITNCYFVAITNLPTNQGKQANTFATAPTNLGELVGNYNVLTAYTRGILCGGTYYVAPIISLTDGNDLSALSAYTGQTCDVTYTRSFTSGKASTVCLPFAYAPKVGETFYTFTGISKPSSEYIADMTEYTGATLVANTPYLFVPSSTGHVDFSGTYAIPADLTAGSTTSGDWTFKGTFATIEWTTAPTTPTYGFSAQDANDGITQGQFVKVGTYVRIKPMRCYLEYNGTDSQFAGVRGTRAEADEQLPETIKVRLIGANGEITAIGTLHTQTGEVALDGWYTLDGRKLDGQPTRKGIYVNNGRKVVIK